MRRGPRLKHQRATLTISPMLPGVAISILAISPGQLQLPQSAADRRRQRTVDTLPRFSAEWFVAFRPLQRGPLKLGVCRDLLEQAPLSAKEAHQALRWRCNSLNYYRATIEGAARVDLDGEPAGQVTADEAAFAKLKVAALERRKRGDP